MDQAAILEEATKRVKEQAFYMKHAMVSRPAGPPLRRDKCLKGPNCQHVHIPSLPRSQA